MRVALVHDWLTGMRGGERCLEAFCELFPDAPIYTLFYIKGSVSEAIERHPIIPSYLNAIPFAKRRYRYFLPLFPSAIQFFDFQKYDLVVSSSHCVAKGIRVPEKTCHLSYIHTPMRYIWDGFENYFGDAGLCDVGRMGMSLFRKRLQQWDLQSNVHVNRFIANSNNVAERIKRQYGRTACVVHPPVDWQGFQVSYRNEGFYLMVTAFAPYKKVDLAIEAANRLGFPLKIIGHGQDEKRLHRMAGPSVEFLGWQPDYLVREWYGRCLAVLFPGEEDFGIVPLEAMATGKPVVAYGRGGALETIIPLNPLPEMMKDRLSGKESHTGNCPNTKEENASAMVGDMDFLPSGPTGVFFYEQSVDALIDAIQLLNQHLAEFDPDTIRAHAKPFDGSHFTQQMQEIIHSGYEEFRRVRPC